jgi:hypothetical protein
MLPAPDLICDVHLIHVSPTAKQRVNTGNADAKDMWPCIAWALVFARSLIPIFPTTTL